MPQQGRPSIKARSYKRIAVQQETRETKPARMSDEELFKELQAKGAVLGFTIERIRP